MALTRKMLKAMGIEEEKIEQIIEAHAETVDALKAEAATAKEAAEKLPEVQKELDALKAKGDDGYKAKYEKEHADYEAYKAEQAAAQAKVARENATRAYFEGKGIKGKNLDIAMRGCMKEIEGLEMSDDGKIKDAKALDDLIGGVYAGLVQNTQVQGTNTGNPPANGAGSSEWTKEKIMAVKDGVQRRQLIAENPALFGLDTNKE